MDHHLTLSLHPRLVARIERTVPPAQVARFAEEAIRLALLERELQRAYARPVDEESRRWAEGVLRDLDVDDF